MTVHMTNATAPMRSFRGRYCSPAPKVYSIRMDLFQKAVELSFKFSLFTVGNQVVQQSRGAPTGSPFSPSVCHAVISLFEHQYFSRMLLSPISSSSQAWVGRYVICGQSIDAAVALVGKASNVCGLPARGSIYMVHQFCFNMRMAIFFWVFMWICREWRFDLCSLKLHGNFCIRSLLALRELCSAACAPEPA